MRYLPLRRLMLTVAASTILVSVVGMTPHALAGGKRCFGKKATIVGTNAIETINGTKHDDVIVGLGGDDTILGQGGDDLICGGKGDDQLVGEDGVDKLNGGDGDDRLEAGPGTTNLLIGGAGKDTFSGDRDAIDIVTFAKLSNKVTVDLQSGTSKGDGKDSFRGIDVVIGTAFDDKMTAGRTSVTFDGGLGDDTIDGSNGQLVTVTYAKAPNSVTVDLTAGTGMGYGSDTLTGITGVIGSPFDDTITGSTDRDTIDGGEGNDTVDGGGGTADTISFASAKEAVTVDLAAGTATGAGSDTFTNFTNVLGSPLGDVINGDDAKNALTGGVGDDTITGGAANDTLDGGDGTDSLDGGDGNDRCLNGEVLMSCES